MSKNLGKNISKNLSGKNSRKLLIMLNNLQFARQYATAWKRAIQTIAEVTSNLSGNKKADKITKVSRT